MYRVRWWIPDCILLFVNALPRYKTCCDKEKIICECFLVSPHRLGRLLVSVLRSEVLQDLLVVTVVDVIAVDLQDDLARLKTRPCRLPAYSMSTQDQRSKVTVWYNYRETVYNTLGYYEKNIEKCCTGISHITEISPKYLNQSTWVHFLRVFPKNIICTEGHPFCSSRKIENYSVRAVTRCTQLLMALQPGSPINTSIIFLSDLKIPALASFPPKVPAIT